MGLPIRNEVGHTIAHVERGFSATKFAHGFLASFGIGSGAAVVEHTIESVKDQFKEASEYAKRLSEQAEHIAKKMRETSELRFDAWLKVQLPEKQISELQKKIEELQERSGNAETERGQQIAVNARMTRPLKGLGKYRRTRSDECGTI